MVYIGNIIALVAVMCTGFGATIGHVIDGQAYYEAAVKHYDLVKIKMKKL